MFATPNLVNNTDNSDKKTTQCEILMTIFVLLMLIAFGFFTILLFLFLNKKQTKVIGIVLSINV